VELGADVVGGIPHYELTREDGVESVKFAMALADEHGLRVDIHCDETDDDHSRFVEVMAAETIRRGMSGRVTASHTTAMHSYNSAYAYRLIANIARAGLHMVTNPLDNSVLQGRFDTGPIRRGHTRVKQLQEAGVNVCVGHDSVMDPWYPLGYGDPLQAAFVLVHLGQMSGDAELRRLIEMITVNPAAALGVPDYWPARGRPGGPGGVRRPVGGGRAAPAGAAHAGAARREGHRPRDAGPAHGALGRRAGRGHLHPELNTLAGYPGVTASGS
jgi:cytosine deaminase